jgi:hypothetical protein
MLILPAVCVWSVLLFLNKDSIAYNAFYILYVIVFYGIVFNHCC